MHLMQCLKNIDLEAMLLIIRLIQLRSAIYHEKYTKVPVMIDTHRSAVESRVSISALMQHTGHHM